MIHYGRYVLLAFLLTCPAHLCAAESDTPAARAAIANGITLMDQAYDAWDPAAFRRAVGAFKTAIELDPAEPLAYYWKGAAEFYLASYYLHAREKDRDPQAGTTAVNEGIRSLDLAIQLDPGFSENVALRGVLRGMHIQLHPWSVFTHGPGVQFDRDRALALDDQNPRVHYLTGISLWRAPEIFGGGAREALKHFHKAETLFEAEKTRERPPLWPSWGYSTCLSFIGDVYASRREWASALAYYRKSLVENARDQRAIEGLERLHTQGVVPQEEVP